MPSLNPDAQAATGYFECNQDAFQQAEARTRAVVRFYKIGSHVIQLRFAGDALVRRLIRSLAHLETGVSRSPALTVCLWDSESTGVLLPAPPWDVEAAMAREQMWGVRHGPVLAAYQFGEGRCLNLLDRNNDRALYWTPSESDLSFWEDAAPLKAIFHWWFRDHGLQFIHAGAVGNSHGGVLLAGKSGSGKSTTTLLCLGLDRPGNSTNGYGRRLRYISDDYTLVTQDDPPGACSLYNAAKLHSGHLQKTMPDLMPAVSNPDSMDREKAVLFLNEAFPERLIERFPVRAIVLPTLTGNSRPALTRVSPALGVSAIVPNTLFQLQWAGQRDMRNMAQAVRRVPVYRLDLGANPEEIPPLIASLLEES